ncbi:MAG: TrkA family potassium uptake protein [Actinomycetes bacterium]|nr:TrkA family potassium uptake protein [Actinomycetota bacterium]
MHYVIMGCGRVGSALAHALESAGHSVSVIDQSREAFRRLGPHYQGETITGVGFDRDTLESAGIARAAGFAAVSNGDNSNILAARTVREVYGVGNVVARIYDPGRAEIYQRLGIPTVATVSWTADQVLRRLLPEGSASEWRDASGTLGLFEVQLAPTWFGHRAVRIELNTPARVAFITRLGKALIPDGNTVLQAGDLIHVIARDVDLSRVESLLAAAPEEG